MCAIGQRIAGRGDGLVQTDGRIAEVRSAGLQHQRFRTDAGLHAAPVHDGHAVGAVVVLVAGDQAGHRNRFGLHRQRAGVELNHIVSAGKPARRDGVAACMQCALAGAAVGQAAAEHCRGFPVDQAAVADARAAAVGLSVVGLAGVVGRDDQGRGKDRELAVVVRDEVVAAAQARGGNRVQACIHRTLAGAAIDQAATEHRRRFAVDETAVADARIAAKDQAIVGLGRGIGGDVQRGRRDGQRSIHIGDGVVAAGEAAGYQRVGAGIDGALGGAAEHWRATQHRGRLAIDKAAVAQASSGKAGAAVGLAEVLRADGERGRQHIDSAAADQVDAVTRVCGAARRRDAIGAAGHAGAGQVARGAGRGQGCQRIGDQQILVDVAIQAGAVQRRAAVADRAAQIGGLAVSLVVGAGGGGGDRAWRGEHIAIACGCGEGRQRAGVLPPDGLVAAVQAAKGVGRRVGAVDQPARACARRGHRSGTCAVEKIRARQHQAAAHHAGGDGAGRVDDDVALRAQHHRVGERHRAADRDVAQARQHIDRREAGCEARRQVHGARAGPDADGGRPHDVEVQDLDTTAGQRRQTGHGHGHHADVAAIRGQAVAAGECDGAAAAEVQMQLAA